MGLIDADAIDDLHDEFAIPASIRQERRVGTYPESGRPRYDVTEHDVTIRVESPNQPKEVVSEAGDSVVVDVTIRLKASEFDSLDIYPAPGDVIEASHTGKTYEVMRILDRQTGVLECDCVRKQTEET
jgi:phage baseplate assembly protein gpV